MTQDVYLSVCGCQFVHVHMPSQTYCKTSGLKPTAKIGGVTHLSCNWVAAIKRR